MKLCKLHCEAIVALLAVASTGVGARAGSSLPRQAGVATRPVADVETLVSGNSAFAVDLYRRLGEGEGNLFFSPYSISTVLAMAYAGARENTEKEMAATLHFSLKQDKLHPAFVRFQAQLKKIQQVGDIDLYVANSLWPQRDHPFLQEYSDMPRPSPRRSWNWRTVEKESRCLCCCPETWMASGGSSVSVLDPGE